MCACVSFEAIRADALKGGERSGGKDGDLAPVIDGAFVDGGLIDGGRIVVAADFTLGVFTDTGRTELIDPGLW